jgi:hypothetical protein
MKNKINEEGRRSVNALPQNTTSEKEPRNTFLLLKYVSNYSFFKDLP